MQPTTAALLLTLLGCASYIARLKRDVWRAKLSVNRREHERRAVFEFLGQMGETSTQNLDMDRTLELIVGYIMGATNADAGAIFLRDDANRDVLHPRVVQGLFPPLHTPSSDKLFAKRKYLADRIKKDTIKVGEGIVGHVAQTGLGLLIPDASKDDRVPKSAGEAVPLEGIILAPLLAKSELLGVLAIVNKRDEGKTFDESDMDLVAALASQAAVNIDLVKMYHVLSERQRLEQELKLAHDFQALLLPREMPAIPGLSVAGISRPALEVGGDFYDFIDVDDDHIGIVIGDVSGKGIPGALVMATIRSTLRAEARKDLSPRRVLQRVNDIVARDTKENVFVTVEYGILNTRTGAFRFSRAGHEPVICCNPGDGALTLHCPNGIVLGLIGGEMFNVTEEMEINLSTAGTVVLYTDGVVEAMNESNEEYGERRFHSLLQSHHGEAPDAIIRELMEDIGRFTRGIAQHDDITMVVLRWDQQAAAMAERGRAAAATNA